MMKLGLHSAILPDDTFEQVIDYAAGIGFKCVDICRYAISIHANERIRDQPINITLTSPAVSIIINPNISHQAVLIV